MLLSFITSPSSFGALPLWASYALLYGMVIVAILMFVEWSEVDWKAVKKRLLIGALLAVVAVVCATEVAAFVYDPRCDDPDISWWDWWQRGCYFVK